MSIYVQVPLDAVIRHESGHAAAYHAMGISVRRVDRIDTGRRQGFTMPAEPITPRQQAKSVIAAWIAESGNAPQWPLNGGTITSTDEQTLAQIADEFGWDQGAYETLVAQTRRLMSTGSYQDAYSALSAALETRPLLDAGALAELLPWSRPKVERRGFATSWLETKGLASQVDEELERRVACERARALARVDQIEADQRAEHEARSWQRLITKDLRRRGYID